MRIGRMRTRLRREIISRNDTGKRRRGARGSGDAGIAAPPARFRLARLGPSAALFIAALAAGLIAWWDYRDDPYRERLVADALSYLQWAVRLATDGLAAEPVFHQPPLYPAFLAILVGLFGAAEAVQALRLVQIVVLALAVALLAPIGRLYLGRQRTGLLAGLLVLLHGPFVFHALKVLPVSVALGCLAVALWALGRFRERPTWPWASAAGAAFGLLALVRAESLLFAPVGFAAVAARAPRTRRAASILAFAALWLGVLAPAFVHNLRRGDFVPVASSGGENFYIGNRAEGNGGYTPIDPLAGDIFSARELARRLAEQAEGRPLRPSEVSAHWFRRGFHDITEDPAGWVRLELRKLGRILHPGDPADIYSFAAERRLFLPSLWGLFLPASAIVLPALVGLALLPGGTRRRAWPLLTIWALALAVLLAFFVHTRLRLPWLYLSAPFAGFALDEALRRGSGSLRRVSVATALLLGLAGAAWVHPTDRDLLRAASVLSSLGREEAGLRILEEALRRSAPDPLILDQAGWMHQKRGDLDEAAALYRRALEAGMPDVRRHQTHTRLGMVLERLGRYDEARREHEDAVRAPFANAGTWYEYGAFLARMGETGEAREALRRAMALDPDWPAPRLLWRRLDDASAAPHSR